MKERSESERVCLLCDQKEADSMLDRVEAWTDGLWRLTVALRSEVLGFSYLEPVRHIPHIDDLDGDEAATFGAVLATSTAALKREAKAERVYIYVFGDGIAHLHVHLAPHREGDPLSAQIVRGEFAERRLPGGATELVSKEFPLHDRDELTHFADRVSHALGGTTSDGARPNG